VTDYPIRQKSAVGRPRPESHFERVCGNCGAAFLPLAPGVTGERGISREWRWYCSTECDPGR